MPWHREFKNDYGLTIDDFLVVADIVPMVTVVEQPNLPAMLNVMDATHGDYAKVLRLLHQRRSLDLFKDEIITLKNFLITRAQCAPTQKLSEIVELISTKNLAVIDQDHLLTNLLYYYLKEAKLSLFEISTLLEHYMVLQLIAKINASENKYFVEFANCVDADGASIFTEREDIPILSQCLRVTSSNAASTDFHFVLDDMCCFEFELELHENVREMPVYYTNTISMQAQTIYAEWMDNPELPCVLPLPILLCYSYSIMQKYLFAHDEGINFRPVTLPTFLPRCVRDLFKGGMSENNDVEYVKYQTQDCSRSFGLVDLQNVHDTKTNRLGTFAHDMKHVKIENRSMNDFAQRMRIHRDLEARWPLYNFKKAEKPLSASQQLILSFKQHNLDSGYGSSITEFLSLAHNSENQKSLKDTLTEILATFTNVSDQQQMIDLLAYAGLNYSEPVPKNKLSFI